MKKLLSFILVAVIFLSITACSSGDDEVYTYPAKTKSDAVVTTAKPEATTKPNETTRATTTKPIVTTTAEETTELAITEPPTTEEPEPLVVAEPDPEPEPEPEPPQYEGGTVYWVDNGEVYHSTDGCRSLARSKNIHSGTKAQSGKTTACKNCY